MINMKLLKRLSASRKVTLMIAAAMLVAAGVLKLTHIVDKAAASADDGMPVLVIDAGHGGVDGGAVAEDGTKESMLNLDIALRLRAISALYGVNYLMVRSEDCSFTSGSDYSEREELEKRVELIDSAEDSVYISIHQNCYPTGQPSGPQVMYARDDTSRRLGRIAQTNLVSQLDPENRRVAVPASEKLYICRNCSHSGILVECGFMSNMWDVQKLCSDAYQKAIAAVLAASYIQFCGGTEAA